MGHFLPIDGPYTPRSLRVFVDLFFFSHVRFRPLVGRSYRRCKCPIWADGLLGKEDIRESLKLRDWQRALDRVHQWESWGSREDPESKNEPKPITISEAWEHFIRDAEARELVPDTLRKYKQLDRLMGEIWRAGRNRILARFHGGSVSQFSRDMDAAQFRRSKAAGLVQSILSLLPRCGVGRRQPGKEIEAPQVVDPPTLPFSRSEVDRILAACSDSLELRAFCLLARFSGLRISDLVSTRADQLHGLLKLRTEKTNVDVAVPLPDYVVHTLEAVKRKNGYFFWSGTSRKTSVADTWRKRLAPIFDAAGIANAHPHRFRDTFACELLLAGVPIERVAKLLGHKSTRITEKHYSAWVLDRQRQLEEVVRRTWADFPEPGTEGTSEVHAGKRLVN